MMDDPIVAEVRAIRNKLAAECGYDVGEIFRRVREREAQSGLEYASCRRDGSCRRRNPQGSADDDRRG